MLQCSDEKQQMRQSFCIFHLSYLILGLVPNRGMFFSGHRELSCWSKRCSSKHTLLWC